MNFAAGSRQTSVTGTTTLLLALVVALLAVLAAPALAATEHCPGANPGAPLPSGYTIVLDNDATAEYDQFDRNNHQPPAGTLVCVKGSGDATGIVTADGVQSLQEILGNDHDVSYYMTYTRAEPTVVLSTDCDGTQATATVTIDNDGDEDFEVEVFINDVSQGTITETTTFDGDADDVLRAEWGEDESAQVTFEDCSESGEPEPSVALSAACDGTQPQATVTIDNDGDEGFEVEVFIDNVSQGTITETTTFDGDALSVLRAEWGEDDSDEVTFEECIEPAFLESTASFTVGSECLSKLPALTYDATISETADDPVGDVVLTVSNASGELGQVTLSESGAGSMVLPSVLEGATVNASWNFDGTTLEQTLASGCSDVLGAVDEREDDPAALPATEVKGEQIGSEQLPNAGAEHVILLVLGSALVALGGFFLRVADRRRTVFG